jgi:sulfur carrier protein ThiS adenylyltransferase
MKFSEIKGHLARYKVGIAGAGGLGSNCAVALARCGVGTLVICDYDVVEIPNLNRQYYFTDQAGRLKCEALKENIEKIDKGIVVEVHNIILNPENIPVVFSGCDVIVEAFDNSEAKEMITETVQKAMPGVPLILGSGVAGWGNPGSVKCRKIDNTLYVCGDEVTEASDETPCIAPRVAIVANMQADTVISILLAK